MANSLAAPQNDSVTAPAASEVPQQPAHSGASLWALVVGSIGVVYGDIGTSPLYAFRVAVTTAVGATGGMPTPAIVFGIASLILWSLIIIVTLKYVVILLRADTNGQVGTLPLRTLAQPPTRPP